MLTKNIRPSKSEYYDSIKRFQVDGFKQMQTPFWRLVPWENNISPPHSLFKSVRLLVQNRSLERRSSDIFDS